MKVWRPTEAPRFVPGAPLYAREPLKFSGVSVPIGGLVPARPERMLRKLWEQNKATHKAPISEPVSIPKAQRREARPRGHR